VQSRKIFAVQRVLVLGKLTVMKENTGGVFMKDNEQYFQTVLNHTSDLLLIVDRNRHIIYSTPNLYDFTGYRLEDLKGVDAFVAVHQEDKEFMMHRHKHLLDSKKSNSTEYRFVKKNGEVRYFECKTTPLPDTENYLQVVSVRDNTERKQMEMELKHHKKRHEVLQNSLKNYSHDLTSVMKLADLEARMIEELVTILPESNPMIVKAFPEKIIKDGTELSDGKMVSISNRIFIKIGDREQRPYILSIQASAIHEAMESIWLETLAHYSMMVFENLNMIESLMHQLETASHRKETPQWVLRMMFNLQEQQRLTLSSDLHDTVLQDQIDLYRRLESLLQSYEIEKEAKTKLIDIEQGLLDIIHEIRVTCNNLRPPLLRELGLASSLENLFEHIQVTSTYRISFNSEDLAGIVLSEEQTIGIYRIVQEFLHYAEEGSKANQVTFDLYYEKDLLLMQYRDDGMGYSATSDHIRLTSITQRAQSLGGKMEITSNEDSGLIAALEFPIHLERSFL